MVADGLYDKEWWVGIDMQQRKWTIGMRTVKTAFAIWLAFWICDLLQYPNGALAAITTIVAIQPSLKGSLTTIKNQLIATTFGCTMAVIVAYYFHGSYTAIAVSALLAIVLCVRFHLKESISLLLVTIILIGQTPLENFNIAVLQRVSMILIGLGIGFSLNFILRPRHKTRLIEHIDDLRSEFEQLYQECATDLIRKEHIDKVQMQERVIVLRDKIQETRNIYQLSVDSKLDYDEKTARDELYLARRSINALASNLERLIEIHRSIILAPDMETGNEIRQHVYQYLMEILYHHRRIYDNILYDKPIADESMIHTIDCREIQLETEMMQLLKNMDNLLPLHYWNITVEAERIMYKTWNLTRMKREVNGEVLDIEEEIEELYRLQ